MKEKAKDLEIKRDIFISYKDDLGGRSFGERLCKSLESMGYSVYFNPKEQKPGEFPERLRIAVENSKDFILILTQSCLDQLIRNEKIDWVRTEILIAREDPKRTIIPLLMPGVSMPKDKEEMPECLRFLPDLDALAIFEPYDRSPLDSLFGFIKSKPTQKYVHRDSYNNSETRNLDDDYNKAKASQNDEALLELAALQYYGLTGDVDGCKRSFACAAQTLEELAKRDSEAGLSANSIIAEMHYHGIMPRKPQSYEEALKYHEKAKGVSGFSAREAAYLRSRGCGCDFDYESIVDYYNDAIERGDTVALIGLARFYKKYGKFNEAAELYRKAKHILPDAEFQLGMLYRDGLLENPPKPDFYKAAYYFQHAIASEKCDAEVYHQLGRLYFTPVGDFDKDFILAEKYFKIAADMGNSSAQYKLGLMYEFGYVNADYDMAIHYHTLAAEQGNPMSAYHLAMLYSGGEQKNYQLAFNYAEYSANKGVMEGEFLYAVFLFYGRGCNADEEKAYKYFTKAYQHGMYVAKVYLDKFNN